MNQVEMKRRQAEEIGNILMFVTILILGNRMAAGGITYMAAAVSVCVLMGMAVSGSLADTLGRLLRSRRNKGQYKNILAMRKSALLFSALLGAVGTMALLLAAVGVAEKVFRVPNSAFVLMGLAPMVLLRTVSCVLQGYFQGEASEMPRAVAGILRQVFTLGFGLLFCHILGGYGEKVSALLKEESFTPMYSCLGIALAVCLAEVFVILFLTVLFKGSRRSERKLKQEGMYAGDSAWDCVVGLCAGRFPQFLTGLLQVLPLSLGLVIFAGRVPEEPGAVFSYVSYDSYAGRYLVVCGILFSLISILTLPVMASIFYSFRKEEGRNARTAFQSGVHACLAQGIYFSVFTAVMGGQVSGLLGGEAQEGVKQMLQVGSALVVFAPLCAYFARFLQAMGKKYFCLCAVGGGVAVFLVTVLVTSGQGILSLVYGGVAASFVLCVLLGVLSYRQLRIRMDWIPILVVPLGAGVAVGLICMLLGRLFGDTVGNLPALLISFLLSGAVYWLLLLALRNFREAELELIPGGRLLGAIARMMHLSL